MRVSSRWFVPWSTVPRPTRPHGMPLPRARASGRPAPTFQPHRGGGTPCPSQPAQWTPVHCSGRDAHTQASTLTEVGRTGVGLRNRFQAGARLFPGALVAPDSTNPTGPQTGGSVPAPALSTLPPGSTDSPSSPFVAPTVRHQQTLPSYPCTVPPLLLELAPRPGATAPMGHIPPTGSPTGSHLGSHRPHGQDSSGLSTPRAARSPETELSLKPDTQVFRGPPVTFSGPGLGTLILPFCRPGTPPPGAGVPAAPGGCWGWRPRPGLPPRWRQRTVCALIRPHPGTR